MKRKKLLYVNIFIICLAIFDLIYSLTFVPLNAIRYILDFGISKDIGNDTINIDDRVNFDERNCRTFGILYYFNSSISITFLVLIAINQYILICHNNNYERVRP